MKFDTSSDTKEFIETVFPRVGARNQAVLGRAALFLALGEGVPPEFKPKDSKGVTLNDEQVVGDDLSDLSRAALNHRAGCTLDETAYRQEFRRHFEFGCHRLRQIWAEAGNDQARFVSALLSLIGGDFGLGASGRPAMPAMPLVEKEVRLKVLVDADEWSVNGPGTNNGLLVISGQPGSGKSQLALDLLAQLGVRFVFFDMKGELEDDPRNPQQRNNRTEFLEQTGARYVRLIQQDLPINPLYRHQNPRGLQGPGSSRLRLAHGRNGAAGRKRGGAGHPQEDRGLQPVRERSNGRLPGGVASHLDCHRLQRVRH
jgi:hypothetical protein